MAGIVTDVLVSLQEHGHKQLSVVAPNTSCSAAAQLAHQRSRIERPVKLQCVAAVCPADVSHNGVNCVKCSEGRRWDQQMCDFAQDADAVHNAEYCELRCVPADALAKVKEKRNARADGSVVHTHRHAAGQDAQCCSGDVVHCISVQGGGYQVLTQPELYENGSQVRQSMFDALVEKLASTVF